MPAPLNPFKAALREGRAQIGLWLALGSAYTAEICATAGFDWMLIDAEHGPNDLRSILAQLQAIAPYPSHAVVRPPSGETALVKQYLDIGCTTLLVPMVETAEQAKALVAAVRYPPEGVRGVGSALARASRWNAYDGYLKSAGPEICLLVQIESRKGLDNLDAIAAVDGVDGVFIGPSDLAASLGHIGNPGHPEVQAAVQGGFDKVRAAGKAAGILTADQALCRRYLDLGFLFVAVGIDLSLLAGAVRSLAKQYAR
jgi:4-hydroxy-2-oxoheptanedioate aldolase